MCLDNKKNKKTDRETKGNNKTRTNKQVVSRPQIAKQHGNTKVLQKRKGRDVNTKENGKQMNNIFKPPKQRNGDQNGKKNTEDGAGKPTRICKTSTMCKNK